MTPEDFHFYASILRKRSGLFLSDEKTYLVQSRLQPLAKKNNFASLEDMTKALRAKMDEKLVVEICEAMTTNESSFFRDQRPFDQFRTVLLPQLLKSRAAKKKIRIWSAASSSGQEAYSLAMHCAEEHIRLQGWIIEIVGTDFSSEIVQKAREGIYSQFEVQRGLPISYLVKYFKQLDNDRWQLHCQIRDMVKFQQGNLLQDFSTLGYFDVIMCRNVLIYFEREDKIKVMNALHQRLATDGALFLGSAETVIGLCDKFVPADQQQGIYIPKQPQASVLAVPLTPSHASAV